MFSYVSSCFICLLCLLCSSVFVFICGFVIFMFCSFRLLFILIRLCTYCVLNDLLCLCLLCLCFVMFLFSHGYVLFLPWLCANMSGYVMFCYVYVLLRFVLALLCFTWILILSCIVCSVLIPFTLYVSGGLLCIDFLCFYVVLSCVV